MSAGGLGRVDSLVMASGLEVLEVRDVARAHHDLASAVLGAHRVWDRF